LEKEDEQDDAGKSQQKGDQVALLRSRIDEQGKLICFLKRRADEQLSNNKTLSSRFEDLAVTKEETDSEVRMLRHHCEMLENRFDDLAENHEEMIKIKDEYKSRCKQLTKDNRKLEEENKNIFSEKLKEQKDKVIDLIAEIETKSTSFDELKKEHDYLLASFNKDKDGLSSENKRLFQELCQTRVRLEDALKDLMSVSSSQKVTQTKESEKLSTLTKEKKELLEQVMSRGRLLQEKQDVIESLQLRVEDQQCEVNKLKEEFISKEQSVSVNKSINQLVREKERLEQNFISLKREYKAFKDHSNRLLTKERGLNQVLSCGRNRMSGSSHRLSSLNQQ